MNHAMLHTLTAGAAQTFPLLYQVLANECSPREIRLFERRLDWYTCKRELRVPVHVCTFRVAVGARRPHRKSNLRKSLLFLRYELPTCADRQTSRVAIYTTISRLTNPSSAIYESQDISPSICKQWQGAISTWRETSAHRMSH